MHHNLIEMGVLVLHACVVMEEEDMLNIMYNNPQTGVQQDCFRVQYVILLFRVSYALSIYSLYKTSVSHSFDGWYTKLWRSFNLCVMCYGLTRQYLQRK